MSRKRKRIARASRKTTKRTKPSGGRRTTTTVRKRTNAQLKRNYRDPTQPGSLGGAARFAKAQGITLKRAKSILAAELGYTLHKPARRRFPTLRVLVFGRDEQWAADLMDVQKLAKKNAGVKYLLTVIDVFSKYAWVVPMKQKTGPQTAKALEVLFATSERRPQKLQTDDGKEFYNKHVTALLKEKGIRHFSTAGDTKASVVERFNRTFKQRLYRYMTTYNTPSYLERLPALVAGYNTSFHRSIGMAPRSVDEGNAREVWQRLYGDNKKGKRRKKGPSSALRVGDKVRLNEKHRPFQKGYLPVWTEEVFVVTRVDTDGNVVTYKLTEWDDTPIKGTFYAEDLQKVTVTDDDLFRIDSVVKRKKDRVLVRWKGWPSKYDSWIDKKDLVRLT